MQKAISFGASAIAQYIYQNNTLAIKERPEKTQFFQFFLDTQLNKNCSKVLHEHKKELWMPDFLIILFSGPSVMLTTDGKKWQIFRPICVLMKFDHMGHQDQDGEKVGQMSLFDQKLEAATDREKQKFIHFQVLLSNLSC